MDTARGLCLLIILVNCTLMVGALSGSEEVVAA